MNLKLFKLLLALLGASILFSSCNEKETTYVNPSPSKDALIYSFALKAIPRDAVDSVAYPILAKTYFSIDETYPPTIFNVDSLPIDINYNRKFATTMSFGTGGSRSKIEIKYKADSIGEWNGSDSIDYSVANGFIVTAADGVTKREYKIQLNTHKIDPDLIVWATNFPKLQKAVQKQKTVLKGQVFYTYYLVNNVMNVSTFDKTTKMWTDQTFGNPLPASTVLESITLFDDKFFAVSDTGDKYTSSDGFNWTTVAGDKAYSILGVLPGKTKQDDQLLVVKPIGAGYEYAGTTDLATLTPLKLKTSTRSEGDVPKHFPARGFSSTTDYIKEKSLILLGGKDFNGNLKNTTWSLALRNDRLEVVEINLHHSNILEPREGYPLFEYDKKLYSVNDTTLVISTNLGATWKNAPEKQALDPLIASKGYGQSILVDDKNYIWIFGGVSNAAIEVWQGRLNKLNPID